MARKTAGNPEELTRSGKTLHLSEKNETIRESSGTVAIDAEKWGLKNDGQLYISPEVIFQYSKTSVIAMGSRVFYGEKQVKLPGFLFLFPVPAFYNAARNQRKK